MRPALDHAFANRIAQVQSGLRFELVLEIVQSCFDESLSVLDIFTNATPNENHWLLHELARKGALIITTNFDNLIEIAGPSRMVVRAASL